MHPLSPRRFQIVYSDSGGGALKQAAMLRGDRLRGLVPYGPIQEAFIGPIDLIAHPFERRAWREAHDADTSTWWGLDAEDRRKADTVIANWWDDLRANPRPTTIWYCSRDIRDISFLLALANEVDFGDDTLLIDIAQTDTGPGSITSIGGCTPERILEASDAATPLTQNKRDTLKQEFRRLASAPKGLRRFDGNANVQEAPIDAHDGTILQFIRSDWRPYRDVMADLYNFQRGRSIRNLEYTFIRWRVDELIANGLVDRRGGRHDPLLIEDPLIGELRLAT